MGAAGPTAAAAEAAAGPSAEQQAAAWRSFFSENPHELRNPLYAQVHTYIRIPSLPCPAAYGFLKSSLPLSLQ